MKRPSPSLVVSILALVVATGGTSYAAATIGTSDIKNNAITTEKINDGAVRSPDIRDGAVQRRDLAPDARGTRGERGPRGAQGPRGPRGPEGPPGTDGVSRWVLVNAAGQIEAASDSNFTIVAAYPASPDAANGNVYINAGEDLADNGIVATIALQNTVDQNGDTIMNGTATGADNNPEFSGEVTVSRCNTGAPTTPPSGPTNCAPEGARNAQSFVVSPRNSDGTRTTADTRKRFYVVLAG